jgi:hypothetical protein
MAAGIDGGAIFRRVSRLGKILPEARFRFADHSTGIGNRMTSTPSSGFRPRGFGGRACNTSAARVLSTWCRTGPGGSLTTLP